MLNRCNRFGFYDHSQVAFTPDRLCLRVLDVEWFSRTAESLGKSAQRSSDPIEEKESFRWLKGYRLACRLAVEYPGTQIKSVADCECDLSDLFLEAQRRATPGDFVIRARVDRRIPERAPEAGEAAYRKVRDQVAASAPLLRREVTLPQTPKRPGRTATLEMRAVGVTVKPPHARRRLAPVTYNVVLVEEVGGPRDGTDVSWLLMTSLPIDSVEAVEKVVDYDTARWPIEVFFRVYKSGCRVEALQLETNHRLKNCLMFYKVIAWRVLYLTFLGRECPEMSCEALFAEAEWKSVWKVGTDEPLPQTAPTLEAFLPMLAQLGGYNRRPKEGPPGPQAIWVGIRRMTDLALAWHAFGPDTHSQSRLVCN